MITLHLEQLEVASFETSSSVSDISEPAALASGEDCFSFRVCYPSLMGSCTSFTIP